MKDTGSQVLQLMVAGKFSREFIASIKDNICGVPILILSDRGLNI